MDSYDVRFWDTKKISDSAGGRYRVRWAAGAAAHYSERLFLLHDLPTLAYYYRPPPVTVMDRAAFGLPVRMDPNCAWSVETSLRVGRELREELGPATGGYLEDPTATIEGMAAVRRGLLAGGIDPQAAAYLDDKILDAEVDTQGKVRFTLVVQRPPSE